MFQKICIKSNELAQESMDVSFLVDSMLFYGKVIVLAHRAELVTLLKVFREDFLAELIKTGRIDLRVRENILGSMNFPGGKHNVDLFSRTDETYAVTLYEAHRILNKNSSKNLSFSDEFSKITQPFKYPKEIVSEIKSSFENINLLKTLLPIYLNSHVPDFKMTGDLQIEILKDGSFGPFEAYSLKTNLDHNKINEASRLKYGEKHVDFDYSGFLLALSESKGDIFIASQFESELVTRKLYSDFIDQEFKDIINRRRNSQENLDLFQEYVLAECHTIGDAFVKTIVTKKELIGLLEKADKFRDWLIKVPNDKSLIGEYHKEVTKETVADKLPTKATRFVLFEGIGVALDLAGAGGIGTALATGLSALDNFYLDKLINGWKPNHFIDRELIPLTKK